MTDRRRDERQVRAFDVFFRPAASEEPWQYGVVTDLSRGGAAVRTECRVEPGTALEIMIMGAAGDALASLAGTVRHARPTGADRWVVGCQFARELSDLEAARLWQAV